MKQGWTTYLLYSSVVLLTGGFIYILVETINRKNTGFETKTLWDWMELLIVPLVLAGGAFYLNRSERAVERQTVEDRTKEDRKLAEERAKLEREIATDRQQEAALQTYFDRMSELLLKEKLRTTENVEVRDVARTRTLSIMRGLDIKRNKLILQFLSEAKLINDEKSIFKNANMSMMNLQGANLEGVNLQGANLQDANLAGAGLQKANLQGANLISANLLDAALWLANLQSANLQSANLQGVYMMSANLQGASLREANLQDANLQDVNLQDAKLQGVNLLNANLQGVNLFGANLRDANLWGAFNITDAQLASVKSLKNATMLDGTKHE